MNINEEMKKSHEKHLETMEWLDTHRHNSDSIINRQNEILSKLSTATVSELPVLLAELDHIGDELVAMAKNVTKRVASACHSTNTKTQHGIRRPSMEFNSDEFDD